MRKIYFIILTIVILIIGFLLYNKLAFLNLVVKFDELEPFDKQMNVYYKGFKIGKTTKIYPDKDYQNTYLKLKLHPHNINLPDNITARIRKSALNNYINIEYPDSPSLSKIKNYDVIKGKITRDLNTTITERLGEDGIVEIVDDATGLIESANTTVKNLGDIFAQVNDILTDMRGDILLASSNLAKTTTNLKEMSSKLNNSVDEKGMKVSVKNIEETTENIKQITQELNGITLQIDRATVPIVNSVLCETNSTMKNVKEITGGIKNTLKKHMGLGRLIFGRPISKEGNQTSCCR